MHPYPPVRSSPRTSNPTPTPLHDDSDLPPLFFPNGFPVTENHRLRSIWLQLLTDPELQFVNAAAEYAQKARQEGRWGNVCACVEAYEAKWARIVSTPDGQLRCSEDLPYPVIGRKSTKAPEPNDITYINVFDFLGQAVLMRIQTPEGHYDEKVLVMQLKLRVAQEMERWKAEKFAKVGSRFSPSERPRVVEVAEKVRNALLEIDEDFRVLVTGETTR